MYLIATDNTADQMFRGIGNAIVAIPKAIWRTHPHGFQGPYHASYSVTWILLVIFIILGLQRLVSR